MPQDARHRVLAALAPLLPSVALLVALGWAHRAAYDSFCPGVPDSGQVRLGTVPWLFWVYESGPTSIGRDRHLQVVWLLACSFFAMPPLVGFLISSGKASRVLLLALLFGLILYGLWCVVQWHAGYLDLFDPPRTLVRLISRAWPGTAWVCSLTLAGSAIGLATRTIARLLRARAGHFSGLAGEGPGLASGSRRG